MKKVFAIFLLVSGFQCLPIEIEEVLEMAMEPVEELAMEHRIVEDKVEGIVETEAEVRMIETKPEPIPEPTADKIIKELKPVPMVAVEGEHQAIVKTIVEESKMDARPEPMAVVLVEQPIDEALPEKNVEQKAATNVEQLLVEIEPEPMAAVLIEEPMVESVPEPEPMAAVLVEQPELMTALLIEEPMVDAVPEPMAEPLADQMMMEDNMAQPLSVLMPEPMTEHIVYNIIDDENNYNHIQMGVPGEAVEGDFAFQADGNLYKTVYTANENGYQAVGDHLPKSPAIPNYPKLNPVENTDEVEALTQVHKHFVNIQRQLIDNTRNPKDSGVDVVRRRRSPVTIPEAQMYIQPYPLVALQPIMPALSYSQFPQPTLNLAHPTYNLGLVPALVSQPVPLNPECTDADLPDEVQAGENQPAALAL